MPRSAGAHALVAFEGEGLGHDADRQDAHLAHPRGAMTGAAPVPVPPPMPAVMNTMWEPASRSMISSRLFLRAGLADIGRGAGAEAFGGAVAELDPVFRLGLGQRPARRCWPRGIRRLPDAPRSCC
ncbi:MAG: hypothetical protein WDN08_13880 [Rhizomicrobium sp.]